MARRSESIESMIARRAPVHEIETAASQLRGVQLALLLCDGVALLGRALVRVLTPSPAAQLHAMDDRMLADIGVQRHEIDYVAAHGRPSDEYRPSARIMKTSGFPEGFSGKPYANDVAEVGSSAA